MQENSQDTFSPNFPYHHLQLTVSSPLKKKKSNHKNIHNMRYTRCHWWPGHEVSTSPGRHLACLRNCLHPHACFFHGLAQPTPLLRALVCFFYLLPSHSRSLTISFWLLLCVMVPPSSFLLSHSILLGDFNQFICITRWMCLRRLIPGHCLKVFW